MAEFVCFFKKKKPLRCGTVTYRKIGPLAACHSVNLSAVTESCSQAPLSSSRTFHHSRKRPRPRPPWPTPGSFRTCRTCRNLRRPSPGGCGPRVQNAGPGALGSEAVPPASRPSRKKTPPNTPKFNVNVARRRRGVDSPCFPGKNLSALRDRCPHSWSGLGLDGQGHIQGGTGEGRGHQSWLSALCA